MVTDQLIKQAVESGWTIDRDNYLRLPGDPSNHWCSRWTSFDYRGRTIKVPHFLERRLSELAGPPKAQPQFCLKAAALGRGIVHSNERYKASRDTLGDVLLDLLHYAKQDDVDFDKELEFAREAFREDQKDQESDIALLNDLGIVP